MKKIRVGIIGIGGRGTGMVWSIAKREDADIVILADRIPGCAEWAIGNYGLKDVKVGKTVEDVLAAGVDAVMVFTGDAHHAEVVVPALDAGKVVFCEKPLDTTLDRCRQIVAADERAGGKTFVGFNLRYAPFYETVKSLVDRGEIGRILTIQADEFYDGGRTYFRRWNRLRREGGGLWITKASHDFDLLTWLSGKRPREIYATAELSYYTPKPEAAKQCRDCRLVAACHDKPAGFGRPWRPLEIREEAGGEPYDLCLYNSEKDTFDHGIATVTFEDGVLATYTCNVVTGFSNRRLRVSGDKGSIDGDLNAERILLQRRDPYETWEMKLNLSASGHGGSDGRILDSFFGFCRGETEPKCRPPEALMPVCMGLAATASSDQHRVVRLDEFDSR